MEMTREARRELSVTTSLAGGLIVVCALGAAGSAAVPDRDETKIHTLGMPLDWIYPAAVWPMLAALVGCGLVIARRPAWVRESALVAAIVAAQVAGYGVVAVRDWFNARGAAGMASHNLATVVTFAASVALCATVATCVAVGLLWRAPGDWRILLRPARPRSVVLGVVVAVGVPLLLGATYRDADITSVGQYALTYSLPWGAALALAGWFDPRGAMVARATVAASVVLVVVTGA
ncbi:hypothetical protein AB0J82_11225 [Asanoa sp. NPDC049518]|uniref:hypothetical protein n=1 Tax=unclassified Asanoa TaxID=2685164 RepID=UPI0034483C79